MCSEPTGFDSVSFMAFDEISIADEVFEALEGHGFVKNLLNDEQAYEYGVVM